MLFCHVFSLFFKTATNASLPSLQNAIYPLSQSQRTIPRTVNGNGGALNKPGILVFLIQPTLWSTNKNKKLIILTALMNLWWVLRWGRNVSHRNLIIYVRRLRNEALGRRKNAGCCLFSHDSIKLLSRWHIDFRGSFEKLSIVLLEVDENRAGPSHFAADRRQKSSAATSQGWQQRYAEE